MTIQIIMTNLTKLRIHICPIGYEIDRIVKSAEQLRADRVWLIVEKSSTKEKASDFITTVKSQLENSRIDVKQKGVSRDDLFDNLKGIKEIFSEEQGNELHVNVSAGSKIQAIAGMMACMIFKEYSPIPYYVDPEKYEKPSKSPQSSGVKDIVQLPEYTIQKPDSNLIKALKIIQKNDRLNKKTLVLHAIKTKLIDSKSDPEDDEVTQSDYGKLDHNIIKPLQEKWKFITVTRIGANHRVSLTDAGKDACKFLV